MNFVVIVADDMRADLLSVMPLTRALGVSFPYAFVSNPTCGPSRVSMLTGDLSRTTGIYGNNEPHGGWGEWHEAGGEDRTIAVALDEAGYRCGLMGKYVNGYNPPDAEFIPPGWSDWMAITNGGSTYYDVEFSVNGRKWWTPPGQYLTDLLADAAWNFVMASAEKAQPFFLWLSPVAPHNFHVPAKRHEQAFLNTTLEVPPSFDEPSTGAAHFAQLDELMRPVATIDETYRNMMRCLLSLDELVARVVQALVLSGVDDDTMLVFCADNGFMLGEHRLYGKSVPYVESTRMPLVVRSPYHVDVNRERLTQSIDIAASIAQLAEVEFACDGVPTLTQPTRDLCYIESGVNLPRPTFVQAQSAQRSYTLYETGEEEWYDLRSDPHQMNSRPEGNGPLLSRARTFVADEMARGTPPGWGN